MNEQTTPMEAVDACQRVDPALTIDAPEVERVLVPEAVKQARASPTVTKERLGAVRGRGVEWVRTSDLLTRATGTVAGVGIRFNAEAADRARRGVATGVRAVSARARQLQPLSAFGHRHTTENAAVRSGVGMR